MNTNKTTLTLALTAAMAAYMGAGIAQASDNPFAMQSLSSGYMMAAADDKAMDGKCGGNKTMVEGKCGGDRDAKAMEGKCGGDKDAKAMEGKCGGDKDAKAKDGKCGEGKCGANKAKTQDKAADGKCGGNKM